MMPYNMTPAPVRVAPILPIDLGQYDESYAGWKIVVNPDAPIDINERLAATQDPDATIQDKMQAMYDWIAACFLAWNFVATDRHGQVTPLPQPGDGGERKISMGLMPLLTQAYNAAIAPPKN